MSPELPPRRRCARPTSRFTAAKSAPAGATGHPGQHRAGGASRGDGRDTRDQAARRGIRRNWAGSSRGPRSSRQGGRHSQMIRCRGQRRIRRGFRREHARGPGRHTNVVRGRRRARKVRRWPCGHDRSREPHRYAGPSSIGVGSAVPNASAGVAHPSTRRGRWLTSAATELSASWVSVDRSAFLCRYWRSSRLVFSLVPCRPAAGARIRDAFERRPRCRGDVHERDSAESGRYHTGKVAPHSH